MGAGTPPSSELHSFAPTTVGTPFTSVTPSFTTTTTTASPRAGRSNYSSLNSATFSFYSASTSASSIRASGGTLDRAFERPGASARGGRGNFAPMQTFGREYSSAFTILGNSHSASTPFSVLDCGLFSYEREGCRRVGSVPGPARREVNQGRAGMDRRGSASALRRDSYRVGRRRGEEAGRE